MYSLLGRGCVAWDIKMQSRQTFTNFSVSLLIWDHHNLDRSRRFIADSLGGLHGLEPIPAALVPWE